MSDATNLDGVVFRVAATADNGVVGNGTRLRFMQRGDSTCDVVALPEGHLRIVEHLTWRTREGGGENIFEEIRHE